MEKSAKEKQHGTKSSKSQINLTIDVLFFVFMLLMIGTGIIIRYVLPPGTGGGHGGTSLLLWGMNRHDFGDLHTLFAIGLMITLLLHLALHWAWVCRTFQRMTCRDGETKKLSPQTMNRYGLVALVITAAMICGLTWSLSPVSVTTPLESAHNDTGISSFSKTTLDHRHIGQSARNHRRETGQNSAVVQGSMTLQEVSSQTGVTLEILKNALHLPNSTAPSERLGRLKRKYGFDIEDVRHIVAANGE